MLGRGAALEGGDAKRKVLNLEELKAKTINDLMDVASDLNVVGVSALRKQELIFKILEAQTEKDAFTDPLLPSSVVITVVFVAC